MKQVELFPRKPSGYYPSLFVMLPLPYRNDKKKIFTRKYKNLEITFYTDINTDNVIPSGKFPRSVMSLIISQYMFQKDIEEIDELTKRTIKLNNVTTTAKQLNIETHSSGKIHKMLTTTINQLYDLNISTTSKTISEKYSMEHKKKIPLFDELKLYWTKESKKAIAVQKELFESYIVISPQFRDLIHENAIPMDMQIYTCLETARQQDLYVWVLKKIYELGDQKNPKKPMDEISFDAIIPQFYDTIYNKTEQRDELINDLLEIKKVYPEGKITTYPEKGKPYGIRFLPSPFHIESKNKGFALG